MTDAELELLAGEVRSYVEDMLAPVKDRLEESAAHFEKRIAAVPAGAKGDKGDPGESVRGEKGESGSKGDPGGPGEKGDPGEKGADAVVDYDKVGEIISLAVAKAVADVPPVPGPKGDKGDPGESIKGDPGERGEKGEPITGERGEKGEKGETGFGTKGDRGEQGGEGPPGRDALDLDIVEEIEEGRCYAFGTYAKYRGGLVKARKHTECITKGLEIAGWQVVIEGFSGFDIDDADPRNVKLKVATTSGKETVLPVRLPVMIDRGVFKSGQKYQRGDVVTWDGSMWVAQTETEDVPGTNKTWRMVVKRGQNGKDAK